MNVTPLCPTCAAPLPAAHDGVIVCGVCLTEIVVERPPAPPRGPRPVQGIAEAHERRAKIEPWIQGLMERYIAAMTEGRRDEALSLMEVVTYLTVWTVYDVDDLDELAPFADPAVLRAAEQLGVPYTSPAERREPVTWARLWAILM